MKLAALAALACAAVLTAERPAEACSCAPPPPPCQSYSRAAVVFTGKVTSVVTSPTYDLVATFEIEEKLKGPLMSKTIVVRGGGMCGATFEAGKKYFVYAGASSGHWYAGLCGRTRSLARAKEDLAHARNLPDRKLAELFGTVRLEDEQGKLSPRAGATVTAQGTSYAATTDQDGKYRLMVPPGKYTLDVVDPGTHVLWSRLPTLEVSEPAACASEDILLRYNGRIRGTLVDHTGKPAAHVPISAQGKATSGALRAVTDAGGGYEIDGVQAGEYLVVVNHLNEGGPDARAPIPTTYYPGVPAEAGAKRVRMVRSGLVEKVDFKLPAPLPVHTVTGVLKQDGKPVSGVHVKISTELRPRYGRGTGAYTDASGGFTFQDIAGAKITLEVCRPDAGPQNYQTACRVVSHTLTKDWTVDLEYPPPSP
jgi:hypothetical protein